MMSIKVDSAGLLAGIPKMTNKLKLALLKGCYVGALKVQKTAREHILRDPKHGTIYAKSGGAVALLAHAKAKSKGKRYNQKAGVVHQASAPGESPANDHGVLASSIVTEKGIEGDTVVATVMASAQYAFPLEHGTKTIAPRPFLECSLNENADAIRVLIAEEIAKALA
jgi:HK97 gp10 family phage protein